MSNVRNVTVNGVKRRVHLEKSLGNNTWAARTYQYGKTVSGFLRKNSSGVLRFTPIGRNASLLG